MGSSRTMRQRRKSREREKERLTQALEQAIEDGSVRRRRPVQPTGLANGPFYEDGDGYTVPRSIASPDWNASWLDD